MWSNRLQLNTAKTEVVWYASSRQRQLPQVALRVGADHVTPSTSVRDLEIYVDSDVSMQTTCPGPCPVICRTTAGDTDRRMRSIRRSVSPAVLRLLVVLLVLSRLDCGNDCVMIGIPPFRGKNDRHTEVGGVRRRAVRVRSIGRSQTATTTAVN